MKLYIDGQLKGTETIAQPEPNNNRRGNNGGVNGAC